MRLRFPVFFVGALGLLMSVSAGSLNGQAPGRKSTPSAAGVSAQQARALLDRYCVSCHNDRIKTANLSLQNLDVARLADHAELAEKVIRKMRAGVMPPPDSPRPALAEYEGLRDWMEAEIDRAATKPRPGSIVLHRLNRTEYANVIRDLLDLRIDATTLLPPDDSAHGFDNIAGSLTLSPTLLESYATAAARVARMAVGYWKSPTEATYLAASDASQNHRLEGIPSAPAAASSPATTFRRTASTNSPFRTSASAASFPASSWRSSSTANARTSGRIEASVWPSA